MQVGSADLDVPTDRDIAGTEDGIQVPMFIIGKEGQSRIQAHEMPGFDP